MPISVMVPAIFAFYYLIHILDHISEFASKVAGILTTSDSSPLGTYGKGGALGIAFGENSKSLATDVRGAYNKYKENKDYYNYKKITEEQDNKNKREIK
jgi:hypothetical protein